MSLVQIAYQSILSKLRDWGRFESREQLQILQHASSLMGREFREVLGMLEQTPHRIGVYDYELFFLVMVDTQKFVLFKSGSRARLNDCSCKSSWLRKVGQRAAYMCIHQILLQLVLWVFPNRIQVERISCEGTAQLAELLDMIG